MAYLLYEQPFQLLTTVLESLPVRRVDYPDERVGLLEVVLPVGTEGLLAANVPCKPSAW